MPDQTKCAGCGEELPPGSMGYEHRETGQRYHLTCWWDRRQVMPPTSESFPRNEFAHQFAKHYRREIEEQSGTLREHPPLVRGGQGRSAREVDNSASWLTWLLLLCFAALVAWKVLA